MSFYCALILYIQDVLSNVRSVIDDIDRELIRLLAQRQRLVEKAGQLKPKGDKATVQASNRVAQVIATVARRH